MKTTSGLNPGDKLFYYSFTGQRSIETIECVVDEAFVKTKEDITQRQSIRFFHGRIKPPEPRIECWMNLYPNGLYPGPYDSEKSADRYASPSRIRCVHFREVRKKKVRK